VNKIRHSEYLYLFGKNLMKLRKLKGLPQTNLAYDANIPVTQIGRIERGEVNTTISTLFAISKALNIPVKELFDFQNTF
jgi:transcriptional regulator with XRE-family HTH domain